MFSRKTDCGFSLIELLIVVAIIGILSSLAMVNFMQAQMRAKVARVKSDLRTIATGLELYAVDKNTYPPDASMERHIGFIMMTTPVDYLSTIFPDPFHRPEIPGRLTYHMGTGNPKGPGITHPATVWALASFGPDGDDDTHIILDYPFTREACPYDPTNGTISNGDIYRLKDTHPNYVTDANPVVY